MKKLYISLDSYILEHFVIIVMQLKTPSFRTLIERRVYKTSMFGLFLIVLVVETQIPSLKITSCQFELNCRVRQKIECLN